MKKTKVVCTMGPNTNDRELLKKLIENGMDVARFNFSHGDHEEQKSRMDLLKELRQELNTNTAILLDTKGPEIRTGVLKGGKRIMLKAGEQFTLTTEEIEGDESKVSITYEGLVQDVDAGRVILIDDGLIELKVVGKSEKEIFCEVINGGELGERKGVNVPNVAVRLPAITEKDKDDIRFGVEQGIDFIAASFVRNAECVLEIKAYLKELGAPYVPIIAKVENAEGIKNIDEIIRAADGVMVARGDLGVEIPAEEVPYLQKMIIQKCNMNFKTVITATQMLDSNSTDQCQTFGPAAGVGLPAHQDQLRLPANRLSKIQCTGFAVSVCTCPGVGPHRDFRHRRPDGLQRRRGSLFRHLCGQRVQGRLVGFFCLRGGQTARKIIQSRVDLGVVLVEIGAFYLVVRLPLIE